MSTSINEPGGIELPDGVRVGHWTDREAWTGCTVVLPPAGTVASGEVRGGGPGTRESDLLSPATNAPGVQAVLLTGGSAFGLGAAAGVVDWLEERGLGYATLGGPVPLVSAAVVYDLVLGGSHRRPDGGAGRAACEAAGTTVTRGSVGVGTGCSVGKLLGPASWTKGGFGAASLRVGDVVLCALAAVNAFGEVLAEDGSVLAGAWVNGAYRAASQLLLDGHRPLGLQREATTLVCLLTDAALTKTEAWLVARAATAGVARAVRPSATPVDGDMVFCLATGRVPADALVLAALGADLSSAAIRDGVRQAVGGPACPSVRERARAA